MKKTINQRVYENPRMSLKMICEYVKASASRRSTIIRDSCIVPTFIAKRYNLASDVIAMFLSINEPDISLLRDQVIAIERSKYSSENEQSMALLSGEAIRKFIDHSSSIESVLDYFEVEATSHVHYHKFKVEGVEISIRPELLLRSHQTNDIVGFVKLYFSKGTPLDDETAGLITCLGKNYFNETHSLNLPEQNCFVLDVFRGEISTAPRAYKRRMSDIFASCREIADRWHRFS